MEFTGERVVPGKVEPDLLNEHLSRYYFAQALVKDQRVLDLGCGTGYGAAILAKSARVVLALDVSQESIEFAKENYTAPNLKFLVSDCNQLAISSGSIDVVVCFEVVEHLGDQQTFLKEVRRVLRRDGVLVISTPNRIYYTEERKEANPFHVREFDYPEFSAFLKEQFEHVKIAFQNHVASIYIGDACLERSVRSKMERPGDGLERSSNYFVAVCSKTETGKDFEALAYLPAAANLLRERERHIDLLETRVSELNQQVLQQQQASDAQSQWCLELNRQVQERTEWAMRLDERIKELDARLLAFQQQHELLEQELRERGAWAQRLSAELSERDQRITALQKEFDERVAWAGRLSTELSERDQRVAALQKELDEKAAWAQRLSAELSERDQRIAALQKEFDERVARVERLSTELSERDQRIAALEKELDERTAWAQRQSAELSECDQHIAALQKELDERTAWAQRQSAELSERDQRILVLQSEFDERTAWALRLNEELEVKAEELRMSHEKLDRINQSKFVQLTKALGLVPKV
jgi:ubiquinone/menaquinone biosynthesis C-methylase UbiE